MAGPARMLSDRTLTVWLIRVLHCVEKFAFLAASATPGTVEKGGVPAPDGPAAFPTGWFETKDRMYAWLTS